MLTNSAAFGIIYLALRQAQKNEYGGIAQLGAHVTSQTTPNLFGKCEKLAVDNLLKMFYNRHRKEGVRRRSDQKSSGKSSYGGIAQLGAHVTSETTPNMFGKYEKLAVDNLLKMFYNRHRQEGTRRCSYRKSSEKTSYGGIAQLGERLNGIQEVSGSIPLISTKTDHKAKALWFVLN